MRHVRESGAVIKPKLVHMLSPFGGTVLHIHYFRRNKLSDGFWIRIPRYECSLHMFNRNQGFIIWVPMLNVDCFIFFILSVRLRITFVGFSHQLFQISRLKKTTAFCNFWFQVFWKSWGIVCFLKSKLKVFYTHHPKWSFPVVWNGVFFDVFWWRIFMVNPGLRGSANCAGVAK